MRVTRGIVGLFFTWSITIALLTGCAQQAASPSKDTSSAAPSSSQSVTKSTEVDKSTEPAKPAVPTSLATVSIGDLGYMNDVPMYIATEKGYFREQGIEAKFERFKTGGDMVAPLGTGQLQVGKGSVAVSLFNAFIRGVDIVSVASAARPIAGASGDVWMVRTDLKDQIKTFRDLKGKTVNVTAWSALYYQLAKNLESEGLSLKDVNITNLGATDVGPAFQNKAIDVALVVEPNVVQFAEKNLAVPWKTLVDLEISTLMFNKKWAAEKPDQAKGFAVAFLKGARDYVKAIRKGPNRQEVVDIAIKYTAVKDPALYDKMEWTYQPPDGYIDVGGLEKIQDWFFAQGELKQRADLKTTIDNSFIDYANQVLGKAE